MAQLQPTTLAQLTNSLVSSGLPTPSPEFLTPILTPLSNSTSFSSTSATSANPARQPPLSSLHATARLRLLTTNLTHPHILSPSTSSLPPSLSSPTVKEYTLLTDIPVQVLEIEDLSLSKWAQIESLESARKGETTKGREIVRTIPSASEAEAPSSASTQHLAQASSTSQVLSKGPFKLLLQDYKGNTIWGFELKKVEKIGYPPVMNIGCKVMLKRGCKVARGMVLLEPGSVVVLGGKIESLDKSWREGREERLRGMVEGGREREWGR